MKTWNTDNMLGFVDESGNMRDGERHVMAALFFSKSKSVDAVALAESLRRQTIDHIDAKGRNRGKKAIELPVGALNEFADGMLKIGTFFVNYTYDATSCAKASLRADADIIGRRLDAALAGLHGADALMLPPKFAVRQFKDESDKHPIYIPLLFYILDLAAKGFREMGEMPNVELCVDEHLNQPEGFRPPTELLCFMLRWLFGARFADLRRTSAAEVFGLRGRSPFTARFGTDKKDAALFLADIYAHSCGMVVKDKDYDGRHTALLRRLDSASVMPQFDP